MVGIPARALVAYGNAELAMRASQAGCKLSWASLAGIGRIESNHGQYGGATLGADGRPSKPIIGVPLDGSPGVKAIGDTDRGPIDGDPTTDRAVGPMHFIPSTWSRWASDGNGDGAGDPQQIDDAALATGRPCVRTGATWPVRRAGGPGSCRTTTRPSTRKRSSGLRTDMPRPHRR